jgi:hypothetical protein
MQLARVDVEGVRYRDETICIDVFTSLPLDERAVDAGGAQHGFVRDAAGLRTIDILGAVSTTPATSEFGTGRGTAVGTIRDDGAIVGAWGDGAVPSTASLSRQAGRASTSTRPAPRTRWIHCFKPRAAPVRCAEPPGRRRRLLRPGEAHDAVAGRPARVHPPRHDVDDAAAGGRRQVAGVLVSRRIS